MSTDRYGSVAQRRDLGTSATGERLLAGAKPPLGLEARMAASVQSGHIDWRRQGLQGVGFGLLRPPEVMSASAQQADPHGGPVGFTVRAAVRLGLPERRRRTLLRHANNGSIAVRTSRYPRRNSNG